jgi:hypothetical protein
MAEGSETYDGLAVPLFGESEIQQQTVANDIITLTGGASQTGDFMVMQNSTGAELFVFSAFSSSSASGLTILASATGAVAAGAETGNAILVQGSSKSIINSVLAFQNDDSAVGTVNSLLAVHGSKGPTYFLSVGATIGGVGAEADNGFFEANIRANSTLVLPSTATIFRGLLCQSGSLTIYLLGAPASNVTAG